MNSIILIGRATKNTEMNTTPSGVSVARFTLAVDRDYNNKDGERDTDFIPIVMYGKSAEFCERNVIKGRLLSVQGALRIDNKKVNEEYKTYVSVEARKIQLLDSKKNETQNTDDAATEGFMNIEDYDFETEGLPFK